MSHLSDSFEVSSWTEGAEPPFTPAASRPGPPSATLAPYPVTHHGDHIDPNRYTDAQYKRPLRFSPRRAARNIVQQTSEIWFSDLTEIIAQQAQVWPR